MKRKIALLSDIHGNTTALEAVLADAKKEQVTDYWFLGDLLAPGTGRRKILDLMATLPISLQVRGNWEDSIWNAFHGKLDISRPSHLYMICLCQYLLEEVTPEELNRLHELPLQRLTKVGDLEIAVTHHLPDKNSRVSLMPSILKDLVQKLPIPIKADNMYRKFFLMKS